jgi:hypothetical protein
VVSLISLYPLMFWPWTQANSWSPSAFTNVTDCHH